MADAPAKAYATHQIKIIGRINVVYTNFGINSDSIHVILQDQELRISSGSAAVYVMKWVGSAGFHDYEMTHRS